MRPKPGPGAAASHGRGQPDSPARLRGQPHWRPAPPSSWQGLDLDLAAGSELPPPAAQDLGVRGRNGIFTGGSSRKRNLTTLWEPAQQSQVKASLWGAVNRKIHGGLEPWRGIGRGWVTGLCRRLEWAGSDGLPVSLSTPALPSWPQAEGSAPGPSVSECRGPHDWAEVGAYTMPQKKPKLLASPQGPEWPGLPTPPLLRPLVP